MPNLNLPVDEALTTTRAVRKRLDLERPVERAVIEECLELALQAPTGSNQQRWRWIVLEDPETIEQASVIYRAAMAQYSADIAAGREHYERQTVRAEQMSESVAYLSDNLHRVPALLHSGVGRPVRRTALWPGPDLPPGQPVGFDHPLGVELHAGPAQPGHGQRLDHHPSPPRAGNGRPFGHPLRHPHPSRPLPRGLHHRHRFPPRPPPPSRRSNRLQPLEPRLGVSSSSPRGRVPIGAG